MTYLAELLADTLAAERAVRAAGFEPHYTGPPGVPLLWRRGTSAMTLEEAAAVVAVGVGVPALHRHRTASPDHFTCACGRWCLNSPCPECEPELRAAYDARRR